ncbi:MAG: hypothetical protein H7X71_06130 [Chitinophagales bacterium]|nr:hypothetical protein [Chitinophagales bacterium]
MEETKKQGNRGLYIILILLLLGLNAWLFYNAYLNKVEQKTFATQISEKDSIINHLNNEYTALQLELASQKGQSAEKDSMITELQNELTARKDEIAGLLKSKNFLNKKSSDIEKLLAEAKSEIASLQADRDTYIARLDSVTAAYQTLLGDYDNLEIEYKNEVTRGDMLVRAKDSIEELGSIILAGNITVSGVRSKGSGKEVEDQKAKKSDRLKICFDLLENKLSAGSSQTIYVKVIDPEGLTLYDANNGSGDFENRENSEDSRYTTSVSMDYAGEDKQSYCVYWNQSAEFLAGDYHVMIFHQGYCAGKNTFSLKKSLL